MAALLIATSAAAQVKSQQLSPPAIHPRTYVSPSRDWQLFVDPTDLYGRGPASYRLFRKEAEVWKGERDYTLYEGAMADDGTIAGYAYTEGIEGLSRSKEGRGDFLIVILDPAGKERLRFTIKRARSRFLHAWPDPKAKGMVLDSGGDLFSVLIADADINRRNDSWLSFELSSGKSLGGRAPGSRPPPEPQTGRAEEAPAAVGLEDVPERKLQPLGITRLEADPAPGHPVNNVATFDFDGSGHLGIVRRMENQRVAFALIEPAGTLLSETLLGPLNDADSWRAPGCAWLGAARWLVYSSPPGIGAGSAGFIVDSETKTSSELKNLECPYIDEARGFGDGGFVVLATKRLQNTQESELIAFDREGRRLWKVAEDHRNSKNPAAIFSPKSLTVTAKNEVAVLDVIRKTVQVFDRGGAFLRGIDLTKAWGRKVNYPTRIAAMQDGGFFIEDFHGSPPLVWTAADGAVRIQAGPPKLADGRSADLRDFRISPDGRLWGKDGSSIMRVTEAGVVDVVLGEPPDALRLGAVAGFAVDLGDRIYAVDRRTGALHVFLPEGKRITVCIPDPGDMTEQLNSPDIVPNEEGSIYLGGMNGNKGHLQFSRDGRRAGWRKLDLDSVTENWHAQPRTGNVWVVGYHDVFLADASGKTIWKIQRRPDGNWLERPGAAQVLPDGSLAVWATLGRGSSTVCIYSPHGEGQKTIRMPASLEPWRFAFDGQSLIAKRGKDLFVLDREGKPLFRFDGRAIDGMEEPFWFFLARGGRELWIMDPKRLEVHRFEMP